MSIIKVNWYKDTSKGQLLVPILLGTDDIKTVFPATPGSLITFIDNRKTRCVETPDEIADLILGVPPGTPPLELDASDYRIYHNQTLVGSLFGDIYDPLGVNESGVKLIAAIPDPDNPGEIIGGRPMMISGSVIDQVAADFKLTSGIPVNTYGYNLELLPDGRTVNAVPKPAPAYSEVTTGGTTDHDLSALPGIWIKVTGDSPALTQNMVVGDKATYNAYVSDLDVRGGAVDIGIGINGAQPAGSIASHTVNPGADFLVSGTHLLLSQLNIGSTFALWMFATNAHANSDIWVLGSVITSYCLLETA